MTIGKGAGYAIQAMALALVVVALWILGPTPTRASARNGAFLYCFTLTSILSGSYVSMFKEFAAAWIYVAVMLLFAVPMWFFSSNYFEAARKINVPFWLGAAGVASVAAATAQQAQLLLDVLPGSDLASLGGLVRPSSLSGSFLHYPLFISLVFFVFVQLWSSRRRAIYGLLAAVFAVAVVVSFSRSGAMILIFGIAGFAVTSRNASQRVRFLFAGISLAMILSLAMRDTIYATRIASSVDLEAGGNAGRITGWMNALELWADSPMIIGGYTGMYTNVTQNFGEASSGVVESGILQQLISVGLIGAVLYYALMTATIMAVDKRHAWLRAGMLGAVLETFVYQSVEVVPFMIAFLLMPIASMHIAGDDPEYWKGMIAPAARRPFGAVARAARLPIDSRAPHADPHRTR
ncbi:O-antigen ligase family protein [Promicromonospora soli]